MLGHNYLNIVTTVEDIARFEDKRSLLKRLTQSALTAVAAEEFWPFLNTEAFITTVAEYTTGTISVTNGSKTVTGSGTTFTAAMVGRKIRVDGQTAYYTIASFSSGTSITLTEPFQGDTDSGLSYSIYKDIYRLQANVDSAKIMRQIENGQAIELTHSSSFDRAYPAPQGTGNPVLGTLIGRDVAEYSTGTVSGTQSARTITGASTSWTTVEGFSRGTKLIIGANTFTVKTVDSDTQVTVYETIPTDIAALTTYRAILDNLLIQAYPIPTTAQNLYYRFQRQPAVLDADEDIPDLPPDMHPMLISWVLGWVWEHKGDSAKLRETKKNYNVFHEKARKHHLHSSVTTRYRRRPTGIDNRSRYTDIPVNHGIPIPNPY